MRLTLWIAAVAIVLFLVDRALLWMEKRVWINYRRTGLSRTGPIYHTLELHSIFEPGMEQVQEVRVERKEEEDEAGDPPVPDPVDSSD